MVYEKKVLLSILVIALLLGCSGKNTPKNITYNKTTIFLKKVIQHDDRIYPFSKRIIYVLKQGEKESKTYMAVNFYKDKIVSMVINVGHVSLQGHSGVASDKEKHNCFNIQYDELQRFLADVIKSLDKEYGISGLRQIITKIEIWGDASVEISQEYMKMRKDSSFSYRIALNDAISRSKLLNDINTVFSTYNLIVTRFWFEKCGLEAKSQYIKNNLYAVKSLPDSLATCDITFEMCNIKKSIH